MRRTTAATLTFLAVLSAACEGPRGERGSDGPPGSPGPAGTPPEISFIEPARGSSATIFTIRGQRFSPVPADNRVFFDGGEATVLTASSALLTVQGGFTPVSDPRTIAVSVEVSNLVSNAVAIDARPNGSFEPLTERSPVWQSVSALALVGTKLYVADPLNGAYLYDTATGVVTAIAQNGVGGIATVQGIFVSPDGKVWLLDRKTANPETDRVLLQQGSTWEPQASFYGAGDRVVGLSFDAASVPYLASAGGRVTRLLADGSPDPDYDSFLGTPVISAAFHAGLFYVLTAAGDILELDTMASPTLFSALADSTLTARDVLVSDGTALYAQSANDMAMEKIDGMGVAAPYGLFYFDAIASAGNGTFLTAFGGGRIALLADAGATTTFVVGGLDDVYSIAVSGGERTFGSAGCNSAAEGTVFAVGFDGVARKRAGICALALGTDEAGALFARTGFGHIFDIAADGALTLLADDTDGMASGGDGAVTGAAGAVYATGVSTGGGPSVARIAGGAVNRDFVILPASAIAAKGLVAGTTSLWIVTFDGLYKAPIGGGSPVKVTSSANFGGTSDGAGGALVSDASGGAIYRATENGVSTFSSGPSCVRLARQPSGNVMCLSPTSELFEVFP